MIIEGCEGCARLMSSNGGRDKVCLAMQKRVGMDDICWAKTDDAVAVLHELEECVRYARLKNKGQAAAKYQQTARSYRKVMAGRV